MCALGYLEDIQFLYGNDAYAVQSALRWWKMDYLKKKTFLYTQPL